MEKLLKILKDVNENIDFENCKTLIDDDYLDSLDIVSIIIAINEEFNIHITPEYIIPSNFNSLESIWSLIENLTKK